MPYLVTIGKASSCSRQEEMQRSTVRHDTESPRNTQLCMECLHQTSSLRVKGTTQKRRQKECKGQKNGPSYELTETEASTGSTWVLTRSSANILQLFSLVFLWDSWVHERVGLWVKQLDLPPHSNSSRTAGERHEGSTELSTEVRCEEKNVQPLPTRHCQWLH